MKNLPLLAAPLAFALLACASLQAATSGPQSDGTGLSFPQSASERGTNVTNGESNPNNRMAPLHLPWVGNDNRSDHADASDATLSFRIVPEPTAAALGAVGLILLLRVRRNG